MFSAWNIEVKIISSVSPLCSSKDRLIRICRTDRDWYKIPYTWTCYHCVWSDCHYHWQAPLKSLNPPQPPTSRYPHNLSIAFWFDIYCALGPPLQTVFHTVSIILLVGINVYIMLALTRILAVLLFFCSWLLVWSENGLCMEVGWLENTLIEDS